MKARHRRGLYAPELLESRIAPATFVVLNLNDSGTGSLRDAVTQANGHAGTDTITFKAGVSGVIDLTGSGISITEPVKIKGPGIDIITVSGQDTVQIFTINYTTASLVPTAISGLSMIDGKTGSNGGALYSKEPTTLTNVVVASSSANDGGGAWIKTAGKVSVTGSRFEQNAATSNVGGLYLRGDAGVTVRKSAFTYNTGGTTGGLYARSEGSHGVVLIDSCFIAGNTATDSAGGLQIATADDGKAIVKNTLISGNTSGSNGGGLYFEDGHLIVDHSTFVGNSAKQGGGLDDNFAKSLVIKNSRFLDNKATNNSGEGGGALYLGGTQPVTISKTVFTGNSSATGGGAIDSDSQVTLTISGSTFLANTAVQDGGAIVLHSNAIFTISGSTLSGNVSGANGGGISANAGATIKATGNIFSENRAASDGGGIGTAGTGPNAVTLTLAGNLFANNIADEGGGVATLGEGKVSMKGDRVLGNSTTSSDGGGLYLRGSMGITVTNLLVQGNLGGDDAGGIAIRGDATVTGCKIIGNLCDYGDGRGGGIFVQSGTVLIKNSVITGNVAAVGGGVYDDGTTTLSGTVVKGNSARTDPNTHGI